MTPRRRLRDKLHKAFHQPSAAFGLLLALLKGHCYRLSLPLLGHRFTVGKNFRVFGRLRLKGAGSVVFGDDVTIGMTVTPFTHSPDAQIQVGSRVYLNGTRFGCSSSISIGDDCILAECRIMDTNFHSVFRERHSLDAPIAVRPVSIGRNVWVCADVALLPGTTIGENSVVSIGSVCRGIVAADSIFAGNPAVRIGAVPSIEDQNEES